MKTVLMADATEQMVANALNAYATMLSAQIAKGKERGQRSREYERQLRLIRGDNDDPPSRGIASRLVPPKPVNPMWETLTPPDHAQAIPSGPVDAG